MSSVEMTRDAITMKEFTNYLISSPSSSSSSSSKTSSRTHLTVTNFPESLKNFLNSVPSTLDLKSCKDVTQMCDIFNAHCTESIERLVNSNLYDNIHLIASLLKKSDSLSEELRSRGNEYYKSTRVREALRCYTLAAAYAPPGSSKHLALAYSNRSACFYEQNEMDRCLDDITRFECTYPGDKTDAIFRKLVDRRQRCEEKKKETHRTDPRTPSHEIRFCDEHLNISSRNDSVPSAAANIQIRYNTTKGRHVVNAGDTIPPGQVVIVEPPYSHVLLRKYSFEYKHCTTCLKDLYGGGVPCQNCVFGIYCSTECATSSSNPHTREECRISHFLHELNMDRTVHLSLSILLHNNRNTETSTMPPPRQSSQVGSVIPSPYDSADYKNIHSLIYHPDILSNKELTRYATYALIISLLLQKSRPNSAPQEKNLDDFQKLHMLHQMNLPCNAHSLYKLSVQLPLTADSIRKSEYEEIGAAAFALLSLLNHSCDPNVVRITLPYGKNAVVTLKPIPKDAELVDNYGVHFATNPVHTRQSHTRTLYNFPCDCPPCTETWPQISTLINTNNPTLQNCKQSSTPKVEAPVGGCKSCKNLKNSYEDALISQNAAETILVQNKPVPSFDLSSVCLDYFDKHVKKPSHAMCISQEHMKQALFLITRHLFE